MSTNEPLNEESPDPANRDPITGSPGAHPVAVGAGAAAAGYVGAIAGASLGGPVGAVVGGAVGAFAGGLVGKGIGEVMDPTKEEAYWAANHETQPYAEKTLFQTFKEAYRTGYQGAGRHASSGRTYEDVEAELRMEYEGGPAAIPWNKAQPAVRAAWDRAYEQFSRHQATDVASSPDERK